MIVYKVKLEKCVTCTFGSKSLVGLEVRDSMICSGELK